MFIYRFRKIHQIFHKKAVKFFFTDFAASNVYLLLGLCAD